MRKYIFIAICAVVLSIMTIPFYMHYTEENSFSVKDNPIFQKESNPLLQEDKDLEKIGINPIEGNVEVEPIPNATGNVIAEPIPNATSDDYNVVNLPYEQETKKEEGFEKINNISIGGLE